MERKWNCNLELNLNSLNLKFHKLEAAEIISQNYFQFQSLLIHCFASMFTNFFPNLFFFFFPNSILKLVSHLNFCLVHLETWYYLSTNLSLLISSSFNINKSIHTFRTFEVYFPLKVSFILLHSYCWYWYYLSLATFWIGKGMRKGIFSFFFTSVHIPWVAHNIADMFEVTQIKLLNPTCSLVTVGLGCFQHTQ